ncbi:M20/M25/M40 family metallo-hydrolase [Nakamurella aerolata]|uniref:M20/M25/M40 family metallo-hydrolase n=1 Tax=Nakamurella aerolata TaxID=1656892 RepID=A0A849A5H0_9ACTN|nr:M20/M25/M40 family metallo-hydrolase [Nakamurella aerolata]NNG34623.1 M20/M25/M40 family metallo-hydrolase [Nakamurella aerolata]
MQLQDVRDYVQAHRAAHQRELADWIAVGGVSATGEAMPAATATEHARQLLESCGLRADVVPTDGHPLVVGHRRADVAAGGTRAGDPAAVPTVVVYGHYDVQPAGPAHAWSSPPFTATVRDGRVFGRGTGDNKGQHLAQLLAIRALAATGGLPCNVVMVLDGEEEIGSPHLQQTLARLRREDDLLAGADLAVWSDGPVHESGAPTVVLGARGIVSFEIVVPGANSELHSGNWGGIAPNPAWELVWLLASMRAPDGSITVPGLVESPAPITQAESAAAQGLPFDLPELLAGAGLNRTDRPDADLPLAALRPTFSINSLTCDDGGDHRTVIPSVAKAKCDIRMVAGQRADDVLAAVRHQVAQQLPHAEVITDRGMMQPYRVRPDAPYVAVIADAMAAAHPGQQVLVTPTLGGSLPVAELAAGLGLDCYGIPLANADERNHAPDENLELHRFHDGIVACAAVLRGIAAAGSAPAPVPEPAK